MEVVGFMPGLPTSRLFNREYEKTPSPEKEEKEEEEQVLDFTYLELEFDALKVSFADELVEIEKRMDGVAMDLPPLKVGEDGKVMKLVSQELIRAIMKSPPHPKPLPDYSIPAVRASTGITDEEDLETIARSFRALQSERDTKNDIIRQYRANGYAYVPLPDNSKRYQPPASGN